MQKIQPERPKTIEAPFACLKPPEIAAILGISRASAYKLVNSEGFPRIAIGRRFVIPKDAFITWMEMNTVTSVTALEAE